MVIVAREAFVGPFGGSNSYPVPQIGAFSDLQPFPHIPRFANTGVPQTGAGHRFPLRSAAGPGVVHADRDPPCGGVWGRVGDGLGWQRLDGLLHVPQSCASLGSIQFPGYLRIPPFSPFFHPDTWIPGFVLTALWLWGSRLPFGKMGKMAIFHPFAPHFYTIFLLFSFLLEHFHTFPMVARWQLGSGHPYPINLGKSSRN